MISLAVAMRLQLWQAIYIYKAVKQQATAAATALVSTRIHQEYCAHILIHLYSMTYN